MKAIIQEGYGSHEVLELQAIDPPVAGPNEALVRVHAASVFVGDWHIMAGLPYVFRLISGVRTPKVHVRGQDVAGKIEAIGDDVTGFELGDEIFGTCDGSFAEYAAASVDKIALKPSNLSFEQAATVPIAGSTALQGLRDSGNIQPGQNVLIVGAAGGVGSFAVQIAKAFDTHVTGVCSTGQVDLVRSIGADDVIDYTRDDFADSNRRFDLILDTAGARTLSHLRRALTPRGTLVIVGAEGGGRWFGGIDRPLRGQLLSPFVSQKLVMLASRQKAEDLIVLKGLIEAGKVTPVIAQTYPLVDVPEAVRRIEEGHTHGKIAITV